MLKVLDTAMDKIFKQVKELKAQVNESETRQA